MKYSLELKVGLIGIILIIIFLLYVFITAPDIENYIEKSYGNVDSLPSVKDIKNNFRTGDLIFLSGNNYGSKSIRWATSSYWSHLAIVVVLPQPRNEILLWECDAGQGAKRGARLLSLSQKLSKHKGYNIGSWKKYTGEKEINFKKLFGFINKFVNKIELQTRIYSYIFSRYGPDFLYRKARNKNKWYCSELVAKTYQYLGILNNEITPSSVSPEDFYNSKNLQDYRKLFNSDGILFKF